MADNKDTQSTMTLVDFLDEKMRGISRKERELRRLRKFRKQIRKLVEDADLSFIECARHGALVEIVEEIRKLLVSYKVSK